MQNKLKIRIDSKIKAAAVEKGGSVSRAVTDAASAWADALDKGESIDRTRLEDLHERYLRLAYPALYRDAEKPQMTSLYTTEKLLDSLERIERHLTGVELPYLTSSSKSGGIEYNRRMVALLALLKWLDLPKSKAA